MTADEEDRKKCAGCVGEKKKIKDEAEEIVILRYTQRVRKMPLSVPSWSGC